MPQQFVLMAHFYHSLLSKAAQKVRCSRHQLVLLFALAFRRYIPRSELAALLSESKPGVSDPPPPAAPTSSQS
jgi:hypothetical protein